MNLLINSWLDSLNFFYPKNIIKNLINIFKIFFKSLSYYFKYFWVFLVIDIFLKIWLGDLITKSMSLIVDKSTGELNFTAFLIYFVTEILWFLIGTIFLILIRESNIKDFDINMFKIDFLRFIQLAFIFSFIIFLSLNILIGSGIEQFPNIHWSFNIILKIFELLVLFYWLDSTFGFRGFLVSVEKTINLILYNLPFLIILFSAYLFCNKISIILEKNFKYVLVQKYMFFIIENIFIVILFVFYSSKKGQICYKSFFEKTTKNLGEDLGEE